MTKVIFTWQTIVVLLFLTFINIFSQQSTDLLQKEAERHFKEGRFGEAISMLNEIISSNPNSFNAFELRAKCYEKRAQLKLAFDDLTKANQLEPNNRVISDELTRIEKKWQTDVDNTIEKLEKESSLHPSSFDNYPILAELYFDKGNIEKSTSLYRKYINSASVHEDVILRYGEILANSNRLKEGAAEFKNFAEKYPDDKMINLKAGYFNLWLGNFSTAEKIFTQILKKDPQFKEAQDGFKQAKSKGYYNSNKPAEREITIAKKDNPVEDKIENYKSRLKAYPKDYKTRLNMVDELLKMHRYEESFDQLQIIISDTLAIPKFSIYRTSLVSKRDSIFNLITEDYEDQLKQYPNQKEKVSKLADYYSIMNDYPMAMKILSNYFNIDGISDAEDLRFRYAQYASWLGNFSESSKQLDFLLFNDPANLEYQALKAKVLVWSNQNLELAERYLENNIKSGNQRIDIILTLATLYIQNDHITNAEKYIDWAKTISPENSELKNVEKLYANYKKSLNDKIVYSHLEDGRKFAKKGEYENAILKFDEYFSVVKKPSESELLEYADLQFRMKNIDKSIIIYDDILKDHYSYDVALLKAKNILWQKKYKEAILEFQKLNVENPDDYESKVLLGEAYQNLKQYKMANSIYNDVLEKSHNEKIIQMVSDRMAYMPQTGFGSLFTDFPSPIGFVPSVNHYSDNQDFSMNNIGGRLEIGIAKILYGGVSYSDVNMFSSNMQKKFVNFKGHLHLKILDDLQLSGSIGAINSINLPRRNTASAVLSFGDNNIFSTQFSYEHTDAAMVLNSPYLLNIRYYTNIYKFAGFFEQSKKLRLSGYFNYITITDGNVGNDFKFRIGSQLLEDTYFGYESRYTSYKYDSPFVPYSNMTFRLYYSPQNLDTHSLWAEWKHEQSKDLKLTFGVELGYMPNYNTFLREIEGRIEYNPISNLILDLNVSTGSSSRYESSYNYFSGSITAYWRVY